MVYINIIRINQKIGGIKLDQVIIDVREPFEYKMGHVKGAKNIPLSKLDGSSELDSIKTDTPIIVYCASGNRSGMAMSLLKSKGYSNVVNGINKATVQAKYLSAS